MHGLLVVIARVLVVKAGVLAVAIAQRMNDVREGHTGASILRHGSGNAA